MIYDNIPRFDLPRDFIAGEIEGNGLLKLYSNFPCRIKAGIFVLCLRGTIRATINLTEKMIRANDLVILAPDSYIQAHEVSEDIQLCFAGFSSEFVSYTDFVQTTIEFLSSAYQAPVISLPDQTVGLYVRALRLLADICVMPEGITGWETIQAILNLFIHTVSELYKKDFAQPQQPHSRQQEIYKEFLSLLMKHYHEEHHVSFYAGKLGLSLQHFSSTIRKVSGRNPMEIINNMIVMEAKVQLKTTDQPVKNIAFNLGFTNVSFFHRYFRRHAGVTPQAYRGGEVFVSGKRQIKTPK